MSALDAAIRGYWELGLQASKDGLPLAAATIWELCEDARAELASLRRGWIDASKEEPEEEQNVLISWSGILEVYVAFFRDGSFRDTDGEFYGEEFPKQPSHWMPLPEPPK